MLRIQIGKEARETITCSVEQVGDDLEGVALINEELLALGGVVHLLRVLGHQRVEEGVELIRRLAPRFALRTMNFAVKAKASTADNSSPVIRTAVLTLQMRHWTTLRRTGFDARVGESLNQARKASPLQGQCASSHFNNMMTKLESLASSCGNPLLSKFTAQDAS